MEKSLGSSDGGRMEGGVRKRGTLHAVEGSPRERLYAVYEQVNWETFIILHYKRETPVTMDTDTHFSHSAI